MIKATMNYITILFFDVREGLQPASPQLFILAYLYYPGPP